MQVTFEKLSPPRGSAFRCFDRRDYQLPARWHRHPEIELTFVPRGDGVRLVGDHIGTFSDNDLVLLGSNLAHTWSADEYRGQAIDMHEAVVAQFTPEFAGADFFKTPDMEPIHELLQRSQRGLWYPAAFAQEIGRQMRAMMSMHGPNRLLCLLTCLTRLADFPNAVELATVGYCGPTTSVSESRMQVIFEHMQQQFAKPSLTTASLAKLIDMNTSAFCRFFKQSTGLTPTSYIGELRIGLACRLLQDSEKSVLEIWFESGFGSASQFNSVFRKRCGLSPREYRTRHRSLRT